MSTIAFSHAIKFKSETIFALKLFLKDSQTVSS